IIRKNRINERCLDIQFGSSKRYIDDNPLESYEIFYAYYIWERTADEGGYQDTIFTFRDNYANQYIDTTSAVPCLYQFDKIKITCDDLPAYLQTFPLNQKSSYQYELK